MARSPRRQNSGDSMNFSRNYRWSVPSGFQDEIKQAFERLFQPDESDQSNVVTSQWTPRVDIREEDKRFVILADIPGVDPNEIEIQMDKGILSIKGERKSDVVEGSGKLSRSERTHGVFYRRFALPDSADADGITASGKHGVLEISIPKRPESSPRRINIAAH
jgi:HSP20 family protein